MTGVRSISGTRRPAPRFCEEEAGLSSKEESWASLESAPRRINPFELMCDNGGNRIGNRILLGDASFPTPMRESGLADDAGSSCQAGFDGTGKSGGGECVSATVSESICDLTPPALSFRPSLRPFQAALSAASVQTLPQMEFGTGD